MKTLKWEDIHLADYLNYYRSIKPYVGTDEYGTKAIINTIFSFTDITDEEYLDLPEAEFTALEEQAFKLLSTTEKMPLVKSFEINGVKYGFIPALDDMTYGEYLDLVTYTKKDLWDNIPTVMSTMYRPITKQLGNSYTIEKYSGTKPEITELFKDGLTMDVVFGALSFFLDLQKDLLIGTQIYLQEMLTNKTPDSSQVQAVLTQSGVSTTQLQSLQEMISSNLTVLQSSPSISV